MTKRQRILRSLLRWSTLIVVAVVILLLTCNAWIVQSTAAQMYYHIDAVPANKVGLVLGSSKRTSSGGANQYFTHRMDAAAELFHRGKVKHLLLSGDNSEIYYNEPIDMKKALLKRGVPDSVITLDYAGFRTLDAVVRSKKIFGQRKITIISQEFHNYRALFISRFHNLDAIAYCASSDQPSHDAMVELREVFARVKAVIDLYILQKDPKFLGEKIKINV